MKPDRFEERLRQALDPPTEDLEQMKSMAMGHWAERRSGLRALGLAAGLLLLVAFGWLTPRGVETRAPEAAGWAVTNREGIVRVRSSEGTLLIGSNASSSRRNASQRIFIGTNAVSGTGGTQ